MKRLFSIIACVIALASLWAAWIDAPVTRDVNGLRMSVLAGAEAVQGIGAYALAVVLLLVAALVALREPWRRWLCWVGVAVVLLALTVPLQMAFGNPDRLRALALENDQYRKMMEFSAAYLPLNRGVEPTFWPRLELGTVWDRFISSCYFLGLGWYLLVAGGLLLLLTGLAYLPQAKARVLTALQALAAVALGMLLFVIQPLRAQRQLQQALVLRGEGQLEKAIQRFQNAMHRDSWWRLGPEVPRQIGELHEQLGRTDTGEFHLYNGFQMERKNLIPSALFEYQRAAETPALRKIGQRETARMLVEQGLRHYRNAVVGSALLSWQEALRADPRQMQAFYYMARAHYDQANLAVALEANQILLSRTSHRLVQANVHANLGDCYQKLGSFAQARAEYEMSKKLDNTQNFRSLIGLVGQ
jgi:tetratricopeptide (TPR) repeat protein